jgi:four helix bundle protein
MKYEDLEIWKIADELVIKIHLLTLNDLPRFEMYETGSRIRRSIKSVKSNIVERFGRRQYKQEFLRFLVIAQASNDEAMDHLKTLWATKSLTDQEKYERFLEELDKLGRKLTLFIEAVKQNHRS